MLVVRDLFFFNSPEWRTIVGGAPVGVTIGNFDGMHLGHQALFGALSKELAASSNAKRVLISFSPHPRRVFSGKTKWELDRDAAYGALSSMREKILFAQAAGFNAVFLIRFNQEFAALDPARFVVDYLKDGLKAAVVVVGHDWCFGKGRAGTPERLQELSSEAGFRVVVVPPVTVGDERVGSRALKQLVEAGDVAKARQYLGRWFSLSARVRGGDKRGRTIGFPTANLEFVSRALPVNGVYATLARVAGREYHSVTNVGVRPTFSPSRQVVEVHLFADTNLYLYGKLLTVEFVQRLRDERKFSGIEELKIAIKQDVITAREVLARERS